MGKACVIKKLVSKGTVVDSIGSLVVSCSKLRLDIEDIAKIFLRLKSGVTADINLSLVNDYEERKCEVITKKHNYSWNLLKDEIKKDNRFIFRNNKYFSIPENGYTKLIIGWHFYSGHTINKIMLYRIFTGLHIFKAFFYLRQLF